MALEVNRLQDIKFNDFDTQQKKDFSWSLREISKPTIIVANKVDLPSAC